MNILLVNDDGIEGQGLKILADHLKSYGKLTIMAPEAERSASGHSIAIHQEIKVQRISWGTDVDAYSISGTPADCVRIANSILNTRFDIVFSGVNNGLNLGTDVIYSGTVSAAVEATIAGIPAVAISTDVNCFDIVHSEIAAVLKVIFDKKLASTDYTLNINFPTREHTLSSGIKVARVGIKRFKTHFKEVKPNHYKSISNDITYDTRSDSDVVLAAKGFITITPLEVEQSSYNHFEILKNLL